MTMATNPINIVFDSDVMINLSEMHYLKTNGVDVSDIDPYSSLARTYKFYETVYNAIVNGEIMPVIVNTVFHEICTPMYVNHKIDTFIDAYCYYPNYNMKNKNKRKHAIKELAEAYCKEYENGGRVYSAPMMKEYVPDLDEYRPTRDAFVVAEASYEKCVCVSANEAHMTKRNRDFHATNTNSRALGIKMINEQHGYGSGSVVGNIPGTISFKDFATIYFKTGKFVVPETDSIFVKASELGD